MNDHSVIFARNSGVIAAETGDEIAMIDFSTGVYHHLNQTGTTIWNLLATPMSAGALADMLAAHYSSPVEAIAGELRPFLDILVEKQILERRTAA